ncbi:MAG TPA: prepilin peptidase, partial [Thermodesulfobium narugense]|nr:prepilin peptidase [Thermodesulfobium narugense]
TIYYIYLKFKNIEVIGMGDVKFLAMIGAFGGVFTSLGALLLGYILGLMIGTPTVLRNKGTQYYIPLGPFLSIGAVVCLFLQKIIIAHL